jgi:hypothetical protein
MLGKDLRRGERRERSFHAWMRRLQNDWWTHGSRLNPRGVYRHLKETGICVIKKGHSWRDRFYCDCFQFDLQGSYRFKNSPTGHESQAAFRKSDGWHFQRIWEERNAVFTDEVRESAWGKSHRGRRREGTHPERICCRRCGYFLKIVQIQNGDWFRDKWAQLCEGCKERDKKRRVMEAA